jgi:uncharacterized membrane protein
VIILPFLGVFVYVIARGHGMGERDIEHARAQQAAMDAYIRERAAGTTGDVERLAKLSELKNRGDISEAEFQRAKEKILH